MRESKKKNRLKEAESYKHPESESPMRPDVGTQAHFKRERRPRPTATILRFPPPWIGTDRTRHAKRVNC
jgi:hypothetical protein